MLKPGQILEEFNIGLDKKATIRVMGKNDTDGIFDVWDSIVEENDFILKDKKADRSKREEWTKKHLQGMTEGRSLMIVAEVNEKIIATSNLERCRGRMNHVADFGVAILKQFRGKQLGTKLTRHVLRIAKKDNIKIARLNLMETNKTAFSLYKKLGFKKNGLLPKGIKRKGKYIGLVEMYKEI